MYFLVLLSALLACTAGVPLNNTKPRLDGRILGTPADITSHPYQVSLLSASNNLCSGSIVGPNWVVTTAYCIDSVIYSDFTVRSGSTYYITGGTLHTPTKIIVHERYNWRDHDYNVALVQVSPAFTYSSSVQPIQLYCEIGHLSGYATVTGWGTSAGGGHFSPTLQRVTVTIPHPDACTGTGREMCAVVIYEDEGPCKGDDGAPLVSNSRLAGLFSVRGACGGPSSIQYYTKVSAVCDWIILNAGL